MLREFEKDEALLKKPFPLLEHKSHCEERSDEANQKIKIRLLRLRLAMTHQAGGEALPLGALAQRGDKGGEVKK